MERVWKAPESSHMLKGKIRAKKDRIANPSQGKDVFETQRQICLVFEVGYARLHSQTPG